MDKNNVRKNTKAQGNQGKKPAPVRRPPKKPVEPAIAREIYAIIAIVSAIFLLISLFMADGGIFIRLISGLFLGLFGIGAYILPILVIALSIYFFLNGGIYLPTQKIIIGGLLFLLTISLAHMIGREPANLGSFGQYFIHYYTNGALTNGGILGAGAASLFILLLAEVGTYILFVTLILILAIQITGKSLFHGIYNLLLKTESVTRYGAQKIRERRESRAYIEDEYEYEDEGEYEYAAAHTPATSATAAPKTRKMTAYNHRIAPVATEDIPKDFEDEDEEDEYAEELPPPFSIKGLDYSNLGLASAAKKAPEHIEYMPRSARLETEHTEEADELPEINVRGIVEGYMPQAIDLSDEPDEDLGDDIIKFPIERIRRESEPAMALPEKIELAPQKIHAPIPPFKAEALPPLKETFEEVEYVFPPAELLKENSYTPSVSSRAQIVENSRKLEETLKSFGVAANVVEVSRGPTVTRYELSPGAGVKVSKISGLADDLALNLAAAGIRIEAPIPGKSVVGIEIPNKETQPVFLREVIDTQVFWDAPSKLSFAMGKDIAGQTVIADIAKMPHLLIAGATGAGKSVCINTLITSIIYKSTPAEVKLLMIDPKVVELSVYNGIPHLLIPVVTDPKKASGALSWAVREMDQRYNLFAENMVRDLKGYNDVLIEDGETTLPQIVIIIDELADLMMTCGKEVEESICRLAQKARAAGIHLIIATQRPSVDVITGLIKANVPSRLAFAVSSGTDSRTILDMTGAEKLLGKGDMLFSPVGLSKPQRIQGSFISDKEVENIVNFIKQDTPAVYSEEMIDEITKLPEKGFEGESDELLEDVVSFIVERGKASTSMIQRRFRIGYNRAARIMEQLEALGYVGPEEGSKPRRVIASRASNAIDE